jgi:dynein heavy chain
MPDDVRKSVEMFMPYSFKSVNQMCELVKTKERRFVYTTPKSFLELIKLFKSMLGKKKNALVEAKERYELGVVKLNET